MTRRIYMAYTGGTFGMMPSSSGLQPQGGLKLRLQKLLPKSGVKGMPQWDLHEYERLIDSAMAQPHDWHTIAKDIASHYGDYDGFVVIHGTDTLAFTASALSFALRGLRKPVIITGSQLPLGEADSDAYPNLFGALMIAAEQAIHEVCVYFNGALLRGNRCSKLSNQALAAFDTPNYPTLGQSIEPQRYINFQLNRRTLLPKSAQELFEIVTPSSKEVVILRLHPGFSVAQLKRFLAPPVAGVILQTFGSGNAPTQLEGFLETLHEAHQRGVIIVNISQCIHGSVEPGRYAAGSALTQAGVISGLDMTVEAAITKLYHLFALNLPIPQIRALMPTALAGELSLA
ncbi:asparaginase domain-containing protein [Thiolinea disciformis]|uniref:asparaginase domain-containing protein n=1 Tax=Thiolinea disciformis TaxID=125614 RepID=UPI000370548C|nr:asparaginase domain-containing protein [Thiolinea disciformis]